MGHNKVIVCRRVHIATMMACSDCLHNRAWSISLIDLCQHSSEIGEETNDQKSWLHHPTRAQLFVCADLYILYAATVCGYISGVISKQGAEMGPIVDLGPVWDIETRQTSTTIQTDESTSSSYLITLRKYKNNCRSSSSTFCSPSIGHTIRNLGHDIQSV